MFRLRVRGRAGGQLVRPWWVTWFGAPGTNAGGGGAFFFFDRAVPRGAPSRESILARWRAAGGHGWDEAVYGARRGGLPGHRADRPGARTILSQAVASVLAGVCRRHRGRLARVYPHLKRRRGGR